MFHWYLQMELKIYLNIIRNTSKYNASRCIEMIRGMFYHLEIDLVRIWDSFQSIRDTFDSRDI